MKTITIIIILFIINSLNNNAYSQTDLSKYKSMFTVNFIRYVGWSEDATTGNFVIGVLKNEKVASKLKILTKDKKFGYQKIVVKEFNNINEITDCQVLFISKYINFSNKNSLIIKQKLNNKNTLIITNSEGAIKKGSMINFVIRNNKLMFEISTSNATLFNLKISSSLTALSNAIIK